MDRVVTVIIHDVLALGAVLAALAAIGVVLRGTVKFVQRVTHFLDDVLGEDARPGVPETPGLVQRIANIEHELHPNSGLSLRDAVDRLEAGQRVAAAERRDIISGILTDRQNIENILGAEFGPPPYIKYVETGEGKT